MLKKFFFLFVLLNAFYLFALDNTADVKIILDNTNDVSNDLYIGKIEFPRLKNSIKRINKELPIRQGEKWNKESEEKLIAFIKTLQDEKILDDTEIKLDITKEGKKVNIKVNIGEQFPFFAIVLPFYTTNSLLKLKFKYFNFYMNGYKVPFEAELEYLQKVSDTQSDRVNFKFKSNDPISINKSLKMSFDISTYTTSLNYAFKSNGISKEWKNGLESIFFKFDYLVPKFDIRLSPSLGVGYANIITTKPKDDITALNDEYHVTMLVPKFEVNIPISSINGNFSTNLGFGFKNEYKVINDRKDVFQKQEISISQVQHNLGDIPKDIKDPLESPINFNFGCPIPKTDASFNFKFNFAFRKTLTGSKDDIDYILIQEFDESTFKDKILGITDIKNDPKTKKELEDSYKYDQDNKKYVIEDNADKKRKVWEILTRPNIAFIYSNGVLATPSFGFSLPIKDTGLRFYPNISFSYITKWQTEYSTINNFSVIPALEINYEIAPIKSKLTANLELKYSRGWITDFDKSNYDKDTTHRFSISKLDIAFEKKWTLDNYYLTMTGASQKLKDRAGNFLKTYAKLEIDPFSDTGIFTPNNFRASLDFQYRLYLPTYKESRFKMRLALISGYNKIIEKIGDDNIVSNTGWIRGNGYDFLGGFFGFISNFEYWIHLFTINTSKFVGIKMKQELLWQIFWVFYTDIGLTLNDKIREPSIDVNNFHLMPAITLGTSVKVYPKFMPLVINLEANINLYKLLITKDFSTATIYFEFSVSRLVEDNWFKL